MNILVIGNGFDLAHGLPTKYSHFLDFVKMFQDYDQSIELYLTEEKPENESGKRLFEFVKYIYDQQHPNDQLLREVTKYADTDPQCPNLLLKHFIRIYNDRCKEGKDGWIDFEQELANIIQFLDYVREYRKGIPEKGQPNLLSQSDANKLQTFFLACRGNITSDLRNFQKMGSDQIEGFAKEITYLELQWITRLLEIYIVYYIERINIYKKVKQIADLKIDKVISFNYTNTYQRLYDEQQKVEYCYIHGKAEVDSSLDTCNLVLGIDEFLPSNRIDCDNTFIWSKKFYQRIYKETDSQYIDWLEDHEKNNKEPLDIYFYGHSLATTDRDVLKRLILHKNAVIHIFYPNKKEMAKQISNLVQIIKEENLIKMTRGRNRTITFIPIEN